MKVAARAARMRLLIARQVAVRLRLIRSSYVIVVANNGRYGNRVARPFPEDGSRRGRQEERPRLGIARRRQRFCCNRCGQGTELGSTMTRDGGDTLIPSKFPRPRYRR